MRTFLLGLLIGSVVVSAVFGIPQAGTRKETMNLGTDLTLGMSEDAAIRKISESDHHPRKMEVAKEFADKGVTSMWMLDDGVLVFSNGKLYSAVKQLLPSDGDELEFGRQLYFALRDLKNEGNSTCTIETEVAEVPTYSSKTGKLRCGKKVILIELQQFQKQSETVQLSEELSVH